MEKLLTFEFEEVQNSIVTPDSLTYGDLLQPYSFLEFLKNTSNNYTPKVYNEFYIEYLKRWNDVKNDIIITDQEIITTQYVDLLRDITLNYSTLEERRFLANIDFNDPEDLEIAIPFFVRKIKEITLLYKSSRDQLTFQIEKNKRKGTPNSIEVAVRQNIIEFLFNNDRFSSLNIPLSTVQSEIKIEIEDLVDTFQSYFNLDATPTDYGSPLREEFYSANVNDVDYANYIDLEEFLRTNVFNNTFLTEIGKNFTVNVNITYDAVCDPQNPIGDFLEEQTVNGVTPQEYNSLRGELVRRLIGVDYYYIAKNTEGEVTSGLLFEAANPVGNLLNVNTASTASVMSDQLTSLKKIGLYFAPEKQSIIRLDRTENRYEIDLDGLEEGVTYVYPDPSLYGKNYDASYPLIFYYNNSSIFRNSTNSFAFGDPKLSPRDQNYYGYYSREQTFETDSINETNFNNAFSSLYNLGYVQDWKQDVYGNEYGLFKDQYGQFFKGRYSFTEIVDTGSIVKYLPFNGWVYNDPVSGYSFNYSQSGKYIGFSDVYKSGVSLSGGNFTSSDVDQYLNFRSFTPYQGIPSTYNLYPEYGSGDLLRSIPLESSTTQVNSTTGTNTTSTIASRILKPGVVYVKDAITGNISPISSALTSTFSKYPSAIQTEVYNSCITIDLFYDTIIVRTPSYLVFDKINYNTTGYLSPNTFNIYLTADASRCGKFSNLFFEPSLNAVFFYKTSTFSELSTDNNKIIYPEIYYFDIDKHRLKKIFPEGVATVQSLSSNFSLYGVISTTNIVEFSCEKISYNKSNDMFVMNYVGYDSNKSPYLFDHKFRYDGESIEFKYSNVYSTDSFKQTSNFHTLTSDTEFIGEVSNTGIIEYTSFNFDVSSSQLQGLTLNREGGYLQF